MKPDTFPSLDPHYRPRAEDLTTALSGFILSASGWRKVFAPEGENSTSGMVSWPDQALICLMADLYSSFIQEQKGQAFKIVVGRDSRPTGSLLADRILRVLLANGWDVVDLGIVTIPEMLAWVQEDPTLGGFIYVSASHNPPGHNGVKFGFEDGSVLGGPLAQRLIELFRTAAVQPDRVLTAYQKALSCPDARLKNVYSKVSSQHKKSRKAYLSLTQKILSDTSWRALTNSLKKFRPGLIAEFNGSARATSIDQRYLEGLGLKVKAFNTEPGHFAHAIIPEGASLDLCRQELVKAHQVDSAYMLGYVPDCDGDRGNVVWFNETSGQAEVLASQEVFALCVLSELTGLVYDQQLTYDEDGYPHERVAVVCNDPTSLRVDRIANLFGVQVFRAEVGEANVVGLARRLRQEGWTVRILGEGSNGGNITFPGTVRDPLSTLGSLLKLLWLKGTPERPGLFALWCQKAGLPPPSSNFTLAEVLASLPRFYTTGVSEERALLQIRSQNHAQLKAAYEKRFLQNEWKQKTTWLKERFGIVAWEEINYEGTEERRGFGPPFRSGKESGGFKLLWKDQTGKPVGFTWMRGSGTEPVFRVMVDIECSDPACEKELLAWHTEILKAVD